LPDRDLGAILLFQATIAILGLFQFGLLNGGLRVFSSDENHKLYTTVNNTNVTYILLISTFVIFVLLISNIFIEIDLPVISLSVAIGGVTLLKAWFSNILVARRQLKLINRFNFYSAVISALLALLVLKIGIIGAFISIGSMPLIFVFLFLWNTHTIRPNRISIKYKVVKLLLNYGFIPYLTGIALLINNQIDRYYIANYITLEALGKYYLATAFMTIFNMLPHNLNTLFLPIGVNFYSKNDIASVIKTTKKYSMILLAYVSLTIFLLLVLGEFITALIFPEKIEQLKYLYIMLPGFIAIVLSAPLSYFIYIGFFYKGILYSNIFSLVSYIILLFAILITNNISIENVAYAKSAQSILCFIFLLAVSVYSYKNISEFKYRLILENKL